MEHFEPRHPADDTAVDRDAANFERGVGLSPELAKTVAEDLHSPGTHKPASLAVDDERAARAQAEAGESR